MRTTALIAGVLALAGCAPAEPAGEGTEGLGGTLTVLAAASLTESFEAIGDDFTALHPDVDIAFSFAGSSSLAAQVTSGAPADVFASASTDTMATVTDAGADATEPVVFARNRLQIAVPPGNPGDVTGLADLADESLAIALCAPEVPCGAAALRVLDADGTTAAPDTLEQDVRAVLSKVRLGEVDAALVYRTDVDAAGDAVEGIDVPDADQAVNDYPITVLRGAPNPQAAQAFVDYVLSADGQAVLADAGFDAP
ncbi:MAG TPA: molybdate ABC transporter substrate-binding protein [Actinomycetales bacterium]|nr:molybdate ABC transporter substrate-binding protein [Actinomycetales bacterium]